jgi:hypothetical protein
MVYEHVQRGQSVIPASGAASRSAIVLDRSSANARTSNCDVQTNASAANSLGGAQSPSKAMVSFIDDHLNR